MARFNSCLPQTVTVGDTAGVASLVAQTTPGPVTVAVNESTASVFAPEEFLLPT